MVWYNLEKNRCPKCGEMLEWSTKSDRLLCSDKNCKFSISHDRMKEMVTEMQIKKMKKDPLQEEYDNFKELDNL